MMLPIVILAGGFGTRIASIANGLPKALMPIRGEPFISHQLKLLKSAGFSEVILSLGYQSQALVDFVKEGTAFGLTVRYVFDGDKLRGTGGAITQALPKLPEHFFVMYGDSYLSCDYAAIQKKYGESHCEGLMTVFYNQDQWDTSNVEYEDGRIIAYSKKNKTFKMHYIDYGLSIFSKKAFLPFVQRKIFDLSEVQEYLASINQLTAFEVKTRFYEIGSIGGIQQLEEHFHGIY